MLEIVLFYSGIVLSFSAIYVLATASTLFIAAGRINSLAIISGRIAPSQKAISYVAS